MLSRGVTNNSTPGIENWSKFMIERSHKFSLTLRVMPFAGAQWTPSKNFSCPTGKNKNRPRPWLSAGKSGVFVC